MPELTVIPQVLLFLFYYARSVEKIPEHLIIGKRDAATKGAVMGVYSDEEDFHAIAESVTYHPVFGYMPSRSFFPTAVVK